MAPDWVGRRVLVSGAGGFIGSHLVQELVRRGATVRAMVHYNARGDLGALASLGRDELRDVEVLYSDVTDGNAIRQSIRGVDLVFHLAALIGIPYSYEAPSSYVSTNIGGTLNMLEAVRHWGQARLVHTSTSETYGTARYVPIDERHPLQAQSPYAASKIGADALAESYHRSFGTPVATIRPFNTYGPRQSARAIIPTIAAQLLQGQQTLRIGDVRPVRDFTFVEDTVRGFLAVADADACLGVVTNIGSGAGITIGDLAHLVAEIIGRPQPELVEEPERLRPAESEVMQLVADAALARERTGWLPHVTLRDGLTRTIEYVRDSLDRYDSQRYVR